MIDRPDISDASHSQTVLGIFAAFAIGQALYLNNGSRDPIGMAWIALAIVALVVAVATRRALFRKLPVKWSMAGFLAIQWMQLLRWGINMPQQHRMHIAWLVIPLIVAGIGAGTMLFVARASCPCTVSDTGKMPVLQKRHFGLALLIVGHALAAAFVIHAVPEPFIDVWNVQQESTAALLHGQNPYQVRYRNIYEPDRSMYDPGVCVDGYLTFSHPYLPLTLIAAAPARIFGDVRWAHLAALEFGALVIALGLRGSYRFFAATMLLLSPGSLFIIHSAWTEPMVLLTIVSLLLCAQRNSKKLWITLGLFLAVKQYVIVIAPLTLLLVKHRRDIVPLYGKALAVACAIAIPFIAWNPVAFFQSIVLGHMHMPFRADSLSFPAILAFFTGIKMPGAIGFVAALIAIAFGLRRAQRTPAGFALATSLVLLVFFSFNRQAFFNYYFLVIGVSCASIAAIDLPRRQAIEVVDEFRMAA